MLATYGCAVVFALTSQGNAGSQGSGLRYDYSEHATRLNADLLTGYNKHVPPKSVRRNSTDSGGSRAGTDVEVQVRFYKVESVSVAEGRMALQMWLRYRWHDDRFAWSPAEYGGVDHTYFMAAGHNKPEETELWVPDVQVYNSAIDVNEIMNGQLAQVFYDGRISWSRPGLLDVLCRFSGLVAFPFDRLQCTFELGGWIMGADLQGLHFFTSQDGGSHLLAWEPQGLDGIREKTVGPAYHEYSIHEVTAERDSFEYRGSATTAVGVPFPVLRYTVTLRRVQSYYLLLVIGPCLLLTCFSFTVFWMKPVVGERLGYGITLILATEVFKLVVDEVMCLPSQPPSTHGFFP